MSKHRRDEAPIGPFYHPDHARPVTRRQFLGQGFLTGSAIVSIPNIISVFARSGVAHAQAAACTLGGGIAQIPFIAIDLAGGANIAGSNVMVGVTSQLDPLSVEGYRKLGLPEDKTPGNEPPGVSALNTELGLVFHNESAMLRGIKSFASPETLGLVEGAIFCARSNNDTDQNPHNPIFGINAAGAHGALLELIGTSSTDTGGRSMSPAKMFDPALRPTKIDRPSDNRGLVDTGELVTLLGQSGAASVMATSEGISNDKVAALAEAAGVTDLLNCAYSQGTQLIRDFGDPDALDPLMDNDIVPVPNDPDPSPPVPIFPDAATLSSTSEYRKVASVMKLIVEGKAGAATIELGGYDYHNGTRATGEAKDQRAGEVIGAALEFARRRRQDLMLYVFSDGSLASNGQIDNSVGGGGKGVWTGDNSSTAASLLLIYRHDDDPAAGRPALHVAGRRQIGRFRDSGSVETSHPDNSVIVSNSPAQLAEAIVLNYLAIHNLTSTYPTVMKGNPALSGNLDDLIAFAPIRDLSVP